MLDKYYSLMDDSIVYWIIMSRFYVFMVMTTNQFSSFAVLHPHYKMSYFHKAKWNWDWITTAESILRTEWALNYKLDTLTAKNTNTMVSKLKQYVYKQQSWLYILHRQLYHGTSTSVTMLLTNRLPQVMHSRNGWLPHQFQMSRMPCDIGSPWQQVIIHWHQWRWISYQSLVSYDCLSIFHQMTI